MKRIAFFACLLWGVLSTPSAWATHQHNAITSYLTELPWTTVDQVLKHVAQVQDHYTYSQLVDMYHNGTLTVEQSGSSYVVRIYNADGAMDIIITDSF